MTRPGISYFILLSLAVHAGALLYGGVTDRDTAKPAGPLRITLQREANAPAGRPTDATTALPATEQPEPEKTPKTARSAATDTRVPVPLASENVPPTPTPEIIAEAATPKTSRSSQPPVLSRTALEAELQGQLRRALLPYFHYPLLARRRGWEGIVRVGVRIEANGALTGLHLVESCPHTVLNRAAVDSLKRVARLPTAGTWLGGGHFDMILPIEYRLTDT
jgi:protein TonB